MSVIGLPCTTHDIAPGVTKVSPVLEAVFMKLDEGWQDGDWHAEAGEGLCSGVPQMWQNQPFIHKDPQSLPAMGSSTLGCIPVPVPLGLPRAWAVLAAPWGPTGKDPWDSIGQPWLTSVWLCQRHKTQFGFVWKITEDKEGPNALAFTAQAASGLQGWLCSRASHFVTMQLLSCCQLLAQGWCLAGL